MNEDTIQRLLYYKGQLLTAQDFNDQQKYHRTKLKQLTARFPYGIVNGLTVIYDPGESSNPEPIVIQEGLAVDIKGDSIALSEHRVSLEGFDSKNCYLSIKYSERPTCSNQSVCETTLKKNRIEESLETKWDVIPNRITRDSKNNITESYITVARLRPKKEPKDDEWQKSQKDGDKKSSETFLILEKKNEPGLPTIRLDAGLIGEAQLDENVKSKLVTDGDKHDHTADHGGAQIPLSGLTDEVQEKLKSIEGIEDKLVTNGDKHDHSGGDGELIPLAGLAKAIRDKLNSVPDDLKDRLVTDGDKHDHTEDHGGAQIPLAGLKPEVIHRLVTIKTALGGTFSTADTNPKYPSFSDNKFRIPNVIPITEDAKISWIYQIERKAGGLIQYYFTITKESAFSGPVEYHIDFAEIDFQS
jgi:hypothetical protein